MKFRINKVDINNEESLKKAMEVLEINHPTTTTEAMYHLDGLTLGISAMISVSETLELPNYVIVDALLKYFPTKFRPEVIPPYWLDIKKPLTLDFTKITPFHELYAQLPDEEKKGDRFREKLIGTYLWELTRMQQEADRANKPYAVLWPFRQAGSQWIAEFEVKDLEKPVKDSYNFHFQNTSQWVYAGCVLVQDGRISTHH